MPEQRFNVTAGAYHMKNQHVLIFNAVDDDVLAREKTPQARTQILIAASSNVGVTGKKKNRSLRESITRSAISMLPLTLAM